ncbi:hypothetical protein NC652_025841 [Populus alba x Populus x berolinensis]|nr:hypothetical protein NC652_025827 [Populus alba x Populus x berolinensis]KAJ6899506.1 hypothetical protein NC652_025841 [Populus alba x Populus x berolinensis]
MPTLLSTSTLSSNKVHIADNAASTTSAFSWSKHASNLSTAFASTKQNVFCEEQAPLWTGQTGTVFLLRRARFSVRLWWGSLARNVAETACFCVIRPVSFWPMIRFSG